MQGDIVRSKALGFEWFVEWIVRHTTVVHGQKNRFAAGVLTERHVIAQPALDPPALIIIAAGALAVILFTALETIDIEIPHIAADLFKAFDQLAVSHGLASRLK